MCGFRWNSEKNEWLKQNRQVSFEQIVKAIQDDDVLADFENSNKDRYPNQYMLIVKIENYVYCVPYTPLPSI
ncbi:BrnT family toxin [Synechocystis sp. LEGE 06083]|nr:BrnT family toxin [Synechocystis sp. LEGE 06083]